MLFHPLHTDVRPPEQFNNPFAYDPHPLCLQAAAQLQQRLGFCKEGKMFGVLIVEHRGEIGYLQAYSGQIEGHYNWPDFVPPVFDYTAPYGWFRQEEARIVRMNDLIQEKERADEYEALKRAVRTIEAEAAEAISRQTEEVRQAKQKRDQRRQQGPVGEAEQASMIRESQFLKAELHRLKRAYAARVGAERARLTDYENHIARLKHDRRQASDQLQRWLFGQFRMLNACGAQRDLLQIFADYDREAHPDHADRPAIPPSGAGECCEPKLLQYAFAHDMRPLCMAMFWWGPSPKDEIRHQGYYYPACRSKCLPILRWMLRGLKVDPNPLESDTHRQLEIVYEDADLIVVNKPEGMLSVPGKSSRESVFSILRARSPHSEPPMMVHRLDMATSGLLVVAKNKRCYIDLQRQFKKHEVRKRYLCLTDPVPAVAPSDASSPSESILQADRKNDTGGQDAVSGQAESILQADRKNDTGGLKMRGVISLPLAPDLEDRPRQRVDRVYGKEAVTVYEILEAEAGRLRIALEPRTGRTHQLRVHCAHPEGLHHPIRGDVLYGRKADRLYLQAVRLTFRHPCTGCLMTFTVVPEF